jgi:hypothetical protein
MSFIAKSQPMHSDKPQLTIVSKEQGESIPGSFPLRNALPKRLSFDALSKEEIDRFRQELYSAAFESRSRGRDEWPGCMQWVFKREGKGGAIQPVGFSIGGEKAALKINGVLRPIALGGSRMFSDQHDSPIKQLTLTAWSFRSIAGPVDLIKSRDDISQDYRKWDTDTGNNLATLNITFPFKSVVEETKSMQCTYLNAKCRRYVAPIQSVSWLFREDKPLSGSKGELLPLALPSAIDLLIEDMCPYAPGALIDAAIGGRVTRYEIGTKKYGFPKNPKLMEALKPLNYRITGSGLPFPKIM